MQIATDAIGAYPLMDETWTWVEIDFIMLHDYHYATQIDCFFREDTRPKCTTCGQHWNGRKKELRDDEVELVGGYY